MAESSEGLSPSRGRFALTFIRKAAVGLLFMALCAAAISIGSDVFGKPGAVIAFIAYLVFLFGVIGLWGAAGDWRVLRLLRQGRLQLEGKVTAGDRVVVSGELQVDGDPLVAPFSQQPCAAYTYQVTGSRRRASGEGVRKYQQLALQGFAMQPIHVEGDGMRLSFMALPEAEPELTESKLGGEWGERARAWLNELAGSPGTRASELESTSILLNAQSSVEPPVRVDSLIYNVDDDGSAFTVREELIPLSGPVCVLGTYEALDQGLSGRNGSILVYRGTAEEVRARLSKEMRDSTRIGLICAVLGGSVCIAPWLWAVAN